MICLLSAAKAHLAARDDLANTNVTSLKMDDPRFKAVADTLADLRAAVAEIEGAHPLPGNVEWLKQSPLFHPGDIA